MKNILFLFILLTSPGGRADALKNEPITPLPLEEPGDAEKVALGKKLFMDPRLSADNSVSCANCHNLSRGAVDGRPVSMGIKGQLGSVNSLTIFNSRYNFRQFWNGRARDHMEQLEGPVNDSKEMGSSWKEIVSKLARDTDYAERFQRIYKGPVSAPHIKESLVAFEDTLVTPNARFDRYLRGEPKALSPDEILGYQKFKVYGCISCHQGMNVGGNMFQVMGLMRNYFADQKRPLTEADTGRYNVTHQEKDRFVFRVPSLRNVAITSPYLHDGSVKTLEAAVKIMAKYQLGQSLPETDVTLIVKFLKTLTGEEPASIQGTGSSR